MTFHPRSVVLVIIFSLLLSGCAGGDGAPILPSDPDNSDSSVELTPESRTGGSVDNNHYLLFLSNILIDATNPDEISYEIIPVRAGEIHLNILKLLEVGPCTDCFKIVGFSFPEPGVLDVDIEITHPFNEITHPFDYLDFSVFDVRGIMMFNGSHLFPVSGKSISDPALGDGALLNAEGYTSLYNGSTFGQAGDLMTYFPGKLSTPTIPDADINGYIRHNTETTRNAFFAGDSVTQTYTLKMPTTTFVFGYAVDANWAISLVTPVEDPIEDFPPEANCPEPWKINVFPPGPGLTDEGGEVVLKFNVYDYLGKISHYVPAVECPELFNGQIYASFKSDGPGYSHFEASVTNENLAPIGTYKCLVSVEDSENDLVGKPWLDLTAYQIVNLDVNPCQPTITVQIPNGGEIWEVETSHAIEWDWTCEIPSVDILLSTDSGITWPNQLNVGPVQNGGDWQWSNIPAQYDTDKARIKVVSHNNDAVYGVSDDDFTISSDPDEDPIAQAIADPNPQTVCEDVHFTDDGSYDPDGGLIQKYEWDWDYEELLGFIPDEEGENADHNWYIPGTYKVQFRVTDDEGATDTLDEPLEIIIENALPTAVADASTYNAIVDEVIDFDGSDSHDNDCDGEEIVEWEWDWENDGVYDDTGETQSHSYLIEGTYYVQLRVTDDEGATDKLDEPLEIQVVEDGAPWVELTVCPDTTGSSYTFQWTMGDDLTNQNDLKVDIAKDGDWEQIGNGDLSYTWNGIECAGRTFRVRVTDSAGHSTLSIECLFDGPDNDPTVQIIDCTPPVFQWSMSDDCTENNDLLVEVCEDGIWKSVDPPGTTSYSWDPDCPDHTFQVRVTDGSGQKTTSNTCHFDGDDDYPTVYITDCNPPVFNWTMSDDCTSTNSLGVEVYKDGSWTTVSSGSTSYTWDPDCSNHTFRVRITDGSGQKTTSNTCYFDGDDNYPTVNLYDCNPPVFNWTMGDDCTSTNSLGVEVYKDGSWTTVSSGSTSYTWDPDCPDHTFRVRITDGIGQKTTSTTCNFHGDDNYPTVNLYDCNPPVFYWTMDDDCTQNSSLGVEVCKDGIWSQVFAGETSYIWDPSGLNHTFKVRITDGKGQKTTSNTCYFDGDDDCLLTGNYSQEMCYHWIEVEGGPTGNLGNLAEVDLQTNGPETSTPWEGCPDAGQNFYWAQWANGGINYIMDTGDTWCVWGDFYEEWGQVPGDFGNYAASYIGLETDCRKSGSYWDEDNEISYLAEWQPFECGVIAQKAGASQAYHVRGYIYNYWMSQGGMNSTYGCPIGNEIGTGSTIQEFVNGSICYDYGDTSAHDCDDILYITADNLAILKGFPESAYSGQKLLWTYGQQLNVPMPYENWERAYGSYTQHAQNTAYWGECVSTAAALCNQYISWSKCEQGTQVNAGTTTEGTVIYTPIQYGGVQHIVIFKQYVTGGIEVWDSNWVGYPTYHVVGKHTLSYSGSGLGDADNYYICIYP